LKVVSLFSGAGGLDLGFVQEGFDVVLANDVKSDAVATYAANFGVRVVPAGEYSGGKGVVALGDVAELDFTPLAGAGITGLIGGPPCQDFSVVRGPRRRGIEVRRGSLYLHFIRALLQLEPEFFVFENVPGLRSANQGFAYQTILADLARPVRAVEELERLGYRVPRPGADYEIIYAGVVDFAKLGVPQRRRRLIIVGVRKDLVAGAGLNDMKEHVSAAMSGAGTPYPRHPLTAIEALTGKTIPEADEYVTIMHEYEGVWLDVGTPRAYRWKREVWDRLTFDPTTDYATTHGHNNLEAAWRLHKTLLASLGYTRPVETLTPPDATNIIPKEARQVRERLYRIPPGENIAFLAGTRWAIKGQLALLYRRLHPLHPSPTIVAHGGGGTKGYHYSRHRGALTNRERARLQTFPDTYIFHGTQTQIRAQIGEAVPPHAARKIANTIKHLLY